MNTEPGPAGRYGARGGAAQGRGGGDTQDPGDAERGVIDDEEPAPGPGTSDPAVALPTAGVPHGGDHVSADTEWSPGDEDDPDSGSGRSDAPDGGYLPGEGTGRPYRD